MKTGIFRYFLQIEMKQMQETMKTFLLMMFAFCLAEHASGQNNFKRNDVYLEAGGNGLWGSVNYERQLTSEPGLGARIGIGFYTESAFYLTIPAGISYLFQLKKQGSFIDAGLGVTWTRMDGRLMNNKPFDKHDHWVNFIPSIGYRKHAKNNLMWRVSITPIANRYTFVPWLGISIGKRF